MKALHRVAIFNDTRRTSHYGCEFVMETLIAQLRARAIEPVFFWPMGEDWRGRPQVAQALRSVDAVIVNGEGSIHHSARRERAHYLAEIAGHAEDTAGIPAFLVNSSLYALEQSVVDKLRRFESIYLRESRSLAALAGSGIAAAVVPDLTLLVAPPPRVARHGVLGTDSVKRDVAQVLKALCQRRGWHHSKLTHAARPRLSEYGLGYDSLRRHAKWAHAALTGRNTRDRRAFLAWLASHTLLCTGRFHAVTLALATRTPFLAVESNTPKISGLLEDVFGNASRVVPLDSLDALADPAARTWSAAEAAALDAFLASARQRSAAMFDHIRDTLDARALRRPIPVPVRSPAP